MEASPTGKVAPRSPLPLLRHTNGGSIGTLERESEGRVDQVAADPVLDSELMKPPGAEVDLLGSCLERIAEQRPNRRHASPESAEFVARAVVIRHLLIEEAADARGKAQREVLIERPFEMQLGAALVICRRVGRVELHAKRARNLEAGLQTEVRISPLEIEGRAVQAGQRHPVGVKVSGRGEAGQGHVPMLLARMPARMALYSVSPMAAVSSARLNRLAATVKSAEARFEPQGTVTAKPGSAPKSLTSGNQLTIAMSATKFSVTLVLLLEPMAGKRLPLP
jgi:hypothetical protein